jgi:hypothetical protein
MHDYRQTHIQLAIEVLREENSGLRQGKTYRVYGMDEILRRRREAGYVWTFRNRSAVRLVKMTAIDKPAAVASSSTDPMDKQPAGMENEATAHRPMGRKPARFSSALLSAAGHGIGEIPALYQQMINK